MGNASLKRQQNLEEFGFTTKQYKSIDGRRPAEQTSQLNSNRFTIWHLNIAGLRSKIDRLRTIIHNAPEKPSIIGICETHLPKHPEYGLFPDIRGYHFYYNNQNSEQGGTCIYVRNNLNASEINFNTTNEQKHRITIIETQDNIVAEVYAPVNTALLSVREDFYTTLAATLLDAQKKHPSK